MTATIETRVQELEARTQALEARLARVEAPPAAGPEVAAAPAPVAPAPAPAERQSVAPPAAPAVPTFPIPAPAGAPRPPRAPRAVPLEDLLGGRVLAWTGGLAVLVGVLFLLVIAVSNGWIGETARTLMGAAVSLALLAAGAFLHERRGRTDAALAASAAGVAGLFACVVVAASAYELVPAAAGLGLALAIGAVATALAIRWAAPGIGALGIGGALLSPVLVGADLGDPLTVALVAVAAAASTAVLVHQRWAWLAFLGFAITTPQWLAWSVADPHAPGAVIAVAAGFGLLTVIAAVGTDMRARDRTPRLANALVGLLALNALVVAVGGYEGLADADAVTAAEAWLAVLALAHAALGAAVIAGRLRPASHLTGLAALASGALLADAASMAFFDSLALTAVAGALAVAFAAWTRRPAAGRLDETFAAVGAGVHVSLGLVYALLLETTAAEATGLAIVAAACFGAGRVARIRSDDWRMAFDAVGLAVLACAAAVALDGAALTATLAAGAIALGSAARRSRDDVAAWSALAYLTLALGHAVAVLAPPGALIDGLADPLATALGLGAAAAAAVVATVLARGGAFERIAAAPEESGLRARLSPAARPATLGFAAALALLHLASVELVTPFAGADAERGQALLSGLWALTGVAALLAGLVRDAAPVRRGGLALLGVTVAKVFLYDLASLTSLYRVGSFIALGLLLLCGAFAWQRLRPQLGPPAPPGAAG